MCDRDETKKFQSYKQLDCSLILTLAEEEVGRLDTKYRGSDVVSFEKDRQKLMEDLLLLSNAMRIGHCSILVPKEANDPQKGEALLIEGREYGFMFKLLDQTSGVYQIRGLRLKKEIGA